MNKPLLFGGAGAIVVGGALLVAGLVRVGENPAKLTWTDPEVKPALMTFAYKVYGNPQVEFGRHYLSKIVFKNTGDHPVTDFSISYKIDEYIPWTDPEVVHEIPAGFSFVELFHPKLPAQVSKLRNATNATFQMRFRWSEEGRQREETYTRNVLLRGVNELAYCDLPSSEVQSWFDLFNSAAFSMAMVTPNDPVVHLYTSEITKLAGGTTAGIAGGAQEVARLCKFTYDYMVASGLRYTGDKGFPTQVGDTNTLVQNVRLPRDVIVNNQGLCIELTLLWCSLLEHLGVDSAMVLIPGHAFVVAYSASQGMPIEQGLPIECTAITPRAVGREALVPFDDAVKMALESLQRAQQDGRIVLLPVEQIQGMGFTPPELADVDVDKLGDTLAKRMNAGNAGVATQVANMPYMPMNNRAEIATVTPMALPTTPSVPPGFTAWSHPQGLVSVAFPGDYVSLMQPGATPNFIVMSMGNPMTLTGCDVMQVNGTQDVNQAMSYLVNSFGNMGLMIQVSGSRQMPNGSIMYEGMTSAAMSATRWQCVAKPIAGGVVFVSAGTHPNSWAAQSGTIQAILASVRFNQ